MAHKIQWRLTLKTANWIVQIKRDHNVEFAEWKFSQFKQSKKKKTNQNQFVTFNFPFHGDHFFSVALCVMCINLTVEKKRASERTSKCAFSHWSISILFIFLWLPWTSEYRFNERTPPFLNIVSNSKIKPINLTWKRNERRDASTSLLLLRFLLLLLLRKLKWHKGTTDGCWFRKLDCSAYVHALCGKHALF